LIPEDGDELGAGFDETPRREAGLPKERQAVLAASWPRLAGDIKPFLYAGRADEIVGHRAIAVEVARGLGAVDTATSLGELVEERTPALQAVERQLGGPFVHCGQLELAARRYAHIRLGRFPALVVERLCDGGARLALELGPDRVVSAAEERCVG